MPERPDAVIASLMAGIKTVILPERNRKDMMEDIPEELRKDMSFIFAKDVRQVLDAALQPVNAPKPGKAHKNSTHLKTLESAPPSPDVVANVPSNA